MNNTPRLSNPIISLEKPRWGRHLIGNSEYLLPEPIDTWHFEAMSDRDQWLNGFADDSTGSVEHIGHVYRVDNRLISTDTLGHSYTLVYASPRHAELAMAACHAQESAFEESD